jgi:hypothetical protein
MEGERLIYDQVPSRPVRSHPHLLNRADSFPRTFLFSVMEDAVRWKDQAIATDFLNLKHIVIVVYVCTGIVFP